MKTSLIAALLLSSAAISAPVFAQSTDASSSAPLTRAEVRQSLSIAAAQGALPEVAYRSTPAYQAIRFPAAQGPMAYANASSAEGSVR